MSARVITLPVRSGPVLSPRKRAARLRRKLPCEIIELDAIPRWAVVRARQAYALYLEASAVDDDNPQLGITLYERALELDPTLAIARVNLGNCHHYLGNQWRAAQCFRAALETDPDLPEALYNLGYLALSGNRLNEAVALFERAVVADPEFADARFNLGLAYMHAGMHPQAKASFGRFLMLERASGPWTDLAREHLARLG